MNSRSLGIAGLLLLLAAGAPADAQLMVFSHLGTEEGLSQSTVNDSHQDQFGFMWFATQNGLNRYDGHQFRTYLRQPGKDGALETDYVWDIAEDAAGDLWLATEGAGLVHWTRSTDRFDTVLPQKLLTEEPDLRLGRSVVVDAGGDIWLGTRGGGLLRFSQDGQLKTRYTVEQGLQHAVVNLVKRGDGGLWIGTEAGLDWLPQGQDRPRAVASLNQAAGGAVAVSSVLEDREGRLWVGGFDEGVFLRAADGQPFQRLLPDEARADSLSSAQIRDLHQDRSGRIWVATQDGLNRHLGDGRFAVSRHRNDDRYSLADSRLMSIDQDRTGLLWIGSRTGGVGRWDPRSLSLGSRAPEYLSGVPLLAFAAAGEDADWIGGFGSGLLKVSHAGDLLARFDPAHGFPQLEARAVTALARDARDRLWIGTMSSGLFRYDPASKEWQHWHQGSEPALPADGVMTLLAEGESVWLGSFGGGVVRITDAGLRIWPAGEGDNELSSGRATTLARGPGDSLWVGTDGGGLNHIDLADDRVKVFRHDRNQRETLGADTIFSLHLAADGQLWIGTAGAGLDRLDTAQIADGFAHLTKADGLSSNVINGIVPGQQGRLWLSSNHGLMRLDSATLNVDIFHREHGLPGEEYHAGAYHRAVDGTIYFGGAGGYNRIRPARVRLDPTPPEPRLTGFEIANEPARLPQAPEQTRRIDIAYDDDVITLAYSALSYGGQSSNRYSVKLEGFDAEWSPLSPRFRSTYTNLDAGRYRFLVRAANANGVWSEEPLEVELHVAAAPWATPLAYGVYVLALMGAIWGFLRWRLRVMAREAHIHQLANFDQPTGLPNQNLFIERLDAVADSERLMNAGQNLTIYCIRIRRFGHLRGVLGDRHAANVMRSLGNRLAQTLIGGEAEGLSELSRVDDDAFAAYVIAPDEAAPEAWARTLVACADQPLRIGGQSVQLQMTLGIARFPDDARSAAELLRNARSAAAEAARNKAMPYAFYAPEMTERARERLRLEDDLRQALEADGLELYLQGKFDLNRRVVGAEALCRWAHPSRGSISPGVFVPLAEESDLILKLDRWMLNKACEVLHGWEAAGRAPVSIAVNVCAESFRDGGIFAMLEEAQSRHPISPRWLEIEVTESVLAADLEEISRTLDRLKAAGYSLSLDDFGTGYSSLTYLQRFPFDNLKIDQAFVHDLEDSQDQQAMVRAIIALAQSLRLKTIAEGVETDQQLDVLGEFGCDHLQGYLLHRPARWSEFPLPEG